ncbi:MAG: hypothetical protein AVDCRST_MAG48-1336 [uncultured Friedmanniella sp.]|uniref:Uncharacterized protein n=1 Tax=uncultured Friedmanniella sp. TaxID=335381 RepID=A0A6J4KBE5_9ACTN|nr:MAG: hypothetical protein AVDCRST_MAG48-1336 [uncultured Friedmanniella sp.]
MRGTSENLSAAVPGGGAASGWSPEPAGAGRRSAGTLDRLRRDDGTGHGRDRRRRRPDDQCGGGDAGSGERLAPARRVRGAGIGRRPGATGPTARGVPSPSTPRVRNLARGAAPATIGSRPTPPDGRAGRGADQDVDEMGDVDGTGRRLHAPPRSRSRSSGSSGRARSWLVSQTLEESGPVVSGPAGPADACRLRRTPVRRVGVSAARCAIGPVLARPVPAAVLRRLSARCPSCRHLPRGVDPGEQLRCWQDPHGGVGRDDERQHVPWHGRRQLPHDQAGAATRFEAGLTTRPQACFPLVTVSDPLDVDSHRTGDCQGQCHQRSPMRHGDRQR